MLAESKNIAFFISFGFYKDSTFVFLMSLEKLWVGIKLQCEDSLGLTRTLTESTVAAIMTSSITGAGLASPFYCAVSKHV